MNTELYCSMPLRPASCRAYRQRAVPRPRERRAVQLFLSRTRSWPVSFALSAHITRLVPVHCSTRASSQQQCALCGTGMRAGVRCGAARPAPTQLRGTVCRLSASLRAAAASRPAQGVVQRTRLDKGCIARLAAAVAAEAEPPRRRGRASVTVGSEAVAGVASCAQSWERGRARR